MTMGFHDVVETCHRPAITAPSGMWWVVAGGCRRRCSGRCCCRRLGTVVVLSWPETDQTVSSGITGESHSPGQRTHPNPQTAVNAGRGFELATRHEDDKRTMNLGEGETSGRRTGRGGESRGRRDQRRGRAGVTLTMDVSLISSWAASLSPHWTVHRSSFERRLGARHHDYTIRLVGGSVRPHQACSARISCKFCCSGGCQPLCLTT
jgi:hypothetical protein